MFSFSLSAHDSAYEEEFPEQISSRVYTPLLRSFRGVFVCAARGRVRHNKIAARICTLAAREIARLPVRTPTIMQSSAPVSCQRSANGHESRRAHVRLNVPTWEPYATQLPSPLHSRATKDTARLCDLEWTSTVLFVSLLTAAPWELPRSKL